MTAADMRHLQRMLQCIAAIRDRSISLVRGADSLLFLRDALDAVEQRWVDDFTAEVATLESAGLASPEQIAEMGERYAFVVREALEHLEGMVRALLPDGDLPTDER